MHWHNSAALNTMNSMSHYQKQQGMTLLELLVAVALLSIIAVMAFASIFTLTESKHQWMKQWLGLIRKRLPLACLVRT